jgi:hypothetical protein
MINLHALIVDDTNRPENTLFGLGRYRKEKFSMKERGPDDFRAPFGVGKTTLVSNEGFVNP